MKWILRGGRLLDPAGGLDESSDLYIECGAIKKIGRIPTERHEVIDVSGKVVVPGLFDMHVHLREPGREDKETLQTGTRAAAKGGFTAVACMPNTTPPIDDVAGVGYILRQARECLTPVYPIACVSKGRKGEEIVEMGKLSEAGAVGFSDDGSCVRSAELMRRSLEYSKLVNLPILDHCEEESLSQGGVMNEGFTSTLLGLQGVPREAEEIIVARDLALARLTGGKLHLCHLSTKRAVELVREAKSRGIQVTAEVTPHHLILTEEYLMGYDTNYKVNPPLRTADDREALLEGLKDGTIDAIASDHAPHTREEKEVEFDLAPFGISVTEITVSLILSELVRKGALSLERAILCLSYYPAKILGREPNRIAEGAPANLTVLDLERERVIHVHEFLSRGKNCPFHEWQVKGAPVMTIVNGNVVMNQGKVVEEWKWPQRVLA